MILSGLRAVAPAQTPARRYFGRGDVLRNATLAFERARTSRSTACSRTVDHLGEGT